MEQPPAPPCERPSPAGYTRPRPTHGHTLQPLTPPVPAPAGRRRIFVHYGGIRRYHDFTALPRPYAEEPRTLEMHPFSGERVMASWASVDTLAIFAARGGRKNACWGASPNPASSAQAPYPAPRRKRRGLLIPLRLLSPRNPLCWACAGAPVWDKVSQRSGCGTGPNGPVPYRRARR